MARLALKRLLAAIPTLFGAIIVVFFVVQLIPGDPVRVMLGENASAAEVEEVRTALGLNDPLPVQFLRFAGRYATGDLGVSIFSRQPVAGEIAQRLAPTVQLALGGVLVAIVLGVPMGVLAAARRGTLVDHLCLGASTLGVTVPNFLIGILLSFAFASKLGWFPTLGAGTGGFWSTLNALVLPSLTLGLAGMALVARMTRSAMIEALGEDYVRTANAKGLSQRRVVYWHALRNAAIPIVTIVGLNFGHLLGGTVVVELIFARPGLGKLLLDALLARDYPVVQGVCFLIAVLFILVNLIVDLLQPLLDPRVQP